MTIRINRERDDNLRPVQSQVLHFTKTDLILWIATAVIATALIFLLAPLFKGGA